MMEYSLFKTLIQQRIKEYLPPVFHSYEAEIRAVPKVGGPKDGFCMFPPDIEHNHNVAVPTFYLEDFYESFAEDEDLERILRSLAGLIMAWSGIEMPQLAQFDFGAHTDRIIACIISSKRNEELLAHVPHQNFLDMSIIYRMAFSVGEEGFDSAIITWEILQGMEMTPEELHETAMENTPVLLPSKLYEGPEEGVYIMSNIANVTGASAMLYREDMQRLAELIGGDFYIVPSSIHEFFAVDVERTAPENLLQMLIEGNHSIVSPSDQLSDSIYRYHAQQEEITIVMGHEPAGQAAEVLQ